MKTIAIFIFSGINFFGMSQTEDVVNNPYASLESKVLQILDSIEYCSLITVDSTGHPRTRIMSPFPADSNFIIWLGTHKKSSKVEQIKNNSILTLAYYNEATGEYVNLYGNGVIINNRIEKESHWKDGWETFYVDRENDYVLIKFLPKWVEVFSYSKGLIKNNETLQPLYFNINP